MDQQINRVKRKVKAAEKDLKRGDKEISKLLKMDHKFDKELDQCHTMKKKARKKT